MTDGTPAEFDLDSALESAYAKTTGQESEVKIETEQDTTVEPVKDKDPVEENTATSGTEESNEAAKPIEAPVSWTAEAKEKFAKLPPDVQEYITQRESEREKLLTQKSTEFSEQQRKYDAVEQVLAPKRNLLAQQYGSEAQALNQLLTLNDFATNDPKGFVQWFAQQRGIDLQNAQNVEASDEYIDPITKQLQTRLQSIEQTLESHNKATQDARQDKIRNEIAEFQTEKDESGVLLRPHFDAVRAEMSSLMGTGAAKTLKHAYEMAIWANPTVRETILSERQKADETRRLESAKQAAQKAEKARGVSVTSKKGGGESGSVKSTNWEDSLADNYDRVVGAA